MSDELPVVPLIDTVVFATPSTQWNKNVDFHGDRALSIDGETVPCVQYTHVPLCSFTWKQGKTVRKDVDHRIFSTDKGTRVVKLAPDYPERVRQAAVSYEPSIICSYLIDLCSTFNLFYQKHRILTEEEILTDARMLMVKGVQAVLKNGLSLLGIKAPERM